MVSFIRPANTDVYVVGDVISDSLGVPAALQFLGIGSSGMVTGAILTLDDLPAGTEAFRLYLFEVEPTNFVDAGPLELVTADHASLVGFIDFDDAEKVVPNVASNEMTSYRGTGVATEDRGISYGTALYGLLQVNTAYVPNSGGQITIRLSVRHD